jgi:thiol-disulfide isomerase/thioredoxin
MKRAVAVLLALAALAAGIALAWRQLQPAQPADGAAVSALRLLGSGALKAPDGNAFNPPGLGERTVVLNFWATWCPPCVDEMPELDRFAQGEPAVQLIGVAIDSPSNVREFLKRTPVSYPIALAGMEGSGMMRDLGNTAGGLPFTVIVDREGRIRFAKMGKTESQELRSALNKR